MKHHRAASGLLTRETAGDRPKIKLLKYETRSGAEEHFGAPALARNSSLENQVSTTLPAIEIAKSGYQMLDNIINGTITRTGVWVS